MKIAYVSLRDLGVTDGVSRKIHTQISVWSNTGHAVRVFYPGKKVESRAHYQAFVTKKTAIRFFPPLPQEMIDMVREYDPDVVYYRNNVYRFRLSRLFNDYPTFIEFNSNDVFEYLNYFRKKRKRLVLKLYFLAFLVYNRLTRSRNLRVAKGHVFVTNELSKNKYFSKYKKQFIVSPNSFDLSILATQKCQDSRNQKDYTHFFFLGSPGQDWHGVDKIRTLATKCPETFRFHLIGLKGIDSDKIKYYGYLHQNEYLKVVSQCHFAIGTLALHRKGMNEASPLKTREYLAMGFPVILGYQDTAFLDGQPEWIFQVPNTPNNINELDIDAFLQYINTYRDFVVNKSDIQSLIGAAIIETRKINWIENQLMNTSTGIPTPQLPEPR